MEISNNRAERSIKLFVIDQKYFLLANTAKGATRSTIIFNLIQAAAENGPRPIQISDLAAEVGKECKSNRCPDCAEPAAMGCDAAYPIK